MTRRQLKKKQKQRVLKLRYRPKNHTRFFLRAYKKQKRVK